MTRRWRERFRQRQMGTLVVCELLLQVPPEDSEGD